MYSHVFVSQVKDPAMLDTIQRIIQDSLLPAAQQLPGLTDILQMVQPETGKLMVVSLWETKEQAQALFASAFASEKFIEMAPLLTETMENEIYEMRL
jgi:heme-degrading monooxygenase HmoA